MSELRPVYTAPQFAEEILGGNHTARWVREQCRVFAIKSVGRKPLLIPRSEAQRFMNPDAK